MKDIIRDFSGVVIGSIETDAVGNKTVRDFYGRILGYYRKADDTTRNFYNVIVARGDRTGMLFNK